MAKKREFFGRSFEMRKNYNGGHLLAAAMGGAAAGVAVALLTAPKSGREARSQLNGYFKNGGRAMRQLPEQVRRGAQRSSKRRSFWG